MYIIPKQLNLAIVPSQIRPGAVVTAIFQNGRYFRNKEAQNHQLSLYIIRFVRRRFQKKYWDMYHTTLSDIVKPFYKMAAISKVIRLSQKLRGAEPSMLTLYNFVGR